VNRDSAEAISPTQFILLLHSVPHLGEKGLARLLRLIAQQRLTPEVCLSLSEAEWRNRCELPPRTAAYLSEQRTALLAKSAEMVRTMHAYPLRVLTFASASYPQRLERNDDAPPPIVYALGNQALLESSNGPRKTRFTFTIAVSNGAPPAALTLQDQIAEALVLQGGVPVTGHDRAPYKRLALAAQRHNRPILYVLDRGLREALGPEFDRPPFAAARIRDAVFDLQRDLAISSFRLDDHGLGANNRRRDSLIFALADTILALDVRAGGGMGQSCIRAQEQGRPVFVALGGRDGNQILRDLGCAALPDSPDWAVQVATAARKT
jgi:predicted Rossmann fold nucleotide-binding protein DprA/Smf involved in DNA uptake